MNYIENTIYYTLDDLKSESGTWLKLSSFENAYEVKEETEFILFKNEFKIYRDEKNFILEFTKGSKAGFKINIENENDILIGKKGTICLDIPSSENHIYKIVSVQDRVFVINECEEILNEGLFYQLHENEQALIRGGDIIKIGRCYFRFIVHNWGVFSEIGDRANQEDKYTIIDDLRIYDELIITYYAVYDGHGGFSCSEYIKKHLHNNLRELIIHRNIRNSPNFLIDLCKVIQDAIIYTDISYYETDSFSVHHGSTCVFILFIGNKVLCCNLGDSIGILIRNNKKVYLSKDFRPNREREKKRILDRGGFITKDERLLGLISVSRAFGDWKFKDPAKQDLLKRSVTKPLELKDYTISNRAEFRILELNSEDEYIILCSDGIFQNVNGNNQIFETINKYLEIERKEVNKNMNVINIPNVVDNVRLDVVNNLYQETSTKSIKGDNTTLIIVNLRN